jgi:large subunit ribosomal protein L21
MYAVIRTGGKQYRVAPNDVIEVEKLPGAAGETVEFGEVLMVGGDGAPKLGAPTVSGASVAGEVLEQKRGEKIVVFKKKRRKNYRRTAGHRQYLTAVRITEILTGGKKSSKTAETAPAKKEDTSGTKKTAAGKSAKAESGTKKTQAKTKAGKETATGKTAEKKADTGKTGTSKTATKKTASGTSAAKKAEGAAGGGTKKAAAKKPAAKKAEEKPKKD